MPTTTATTPSEDALIFCHPGPSRLIPSVSSFVLKLETYFRMVEVPYKNEFSVKTSSKSKVPFIKCEGKEVTDTNFIIPFLNKKYEKNLDSILNGQEKAISLAFKRLIEENLYWTLTHFRWIENFSNFSKQLPVSGFRKKIFPLAAPLIFKPGVKSSLQGHGMGRHSVEEIHEIMKQDMKALSEFLDSKQYFMGDEPTEIDASLFGMLAQIAYAAPGSPHEKLMKEEMQNLAEYTDRMRDRYFPDWDQILPSQEKKKEEEVVPNVKDGAEEVKDNKKNGAEENGSEKDAEEKEGQNQDEEKTENGKTEEVQDESGTPEK